MRYLVFLLCFLPSFVISDDSLINPVAKKIKTTVLKGLNRSQVELEGYCDLMIEMKHAKGYAQIKKVRTSGDGKICKAAKKHFDLLQ
jgi:hypothetical protein